MPIPRSWSWMMTAMRNVFISYARKDGADEAEHLYNALIARGIPAWRDVVNLNPYEDFSGEIEASIIAATHVVVCVTPDIRRPDSFVRREIAFALEENKPIIPLLFPGGRRPITIINHTYIDFSDWDTGFDALLERLEQAVGEAVPETRRDQELAYLQQVGQRYDHWRDLYTDLAASTRIETPKVKVKAGAAARYLEMQHDIFKSISHDSDDDQSKKVTVQSFDELRDGIRQYSQVALIGDPGAGKTTTIERLAYELATAAAESEDEPLPLVVRLGTYDGRDFDRFLEEAFGGLELNRFLPNRLFLLLDGLNEMQRQYVPVIDAWLREHTATKAVVTCRKLDYVNHKFPLQRIDVAPLDIHRIYLFIGNYLEDEDREKLFWSLSGTQTREAWEWFQQANKNHSFDDFWTGTTPKAYSWELERSHLKELQDLLREEGRLPGMLGVVSNPFLLFITIQIYTRTGEPPTNRGQLFDQFVTLLMEQRGKTAATIRPPWIDGTIQRQALAALAYEMQNEHTGTSVDLDWAKQVIGRALPGEDVDQLLYLAASASLLEFGKTIRFVHQLLQEFFAAYKMNEDLQQGVSARKYWSSEQWWEPSGWEETALLLAGKGDNASSVVRWLTPVQPSLAYRCATESGAPCAEDAWLGLYDPPSGARYSPLARAEWGRILGIRGDNRPGVGLGQDNLPDIDWVEIPQGEFIYQEGERLYLPTFYIARYPVTYQQFQVFLDDPEGFEKIEWWAEVEENAYRQPIKEQEFKYANHPRENVSWYQALAFCRWLSAKLGYEVRLPTEQEWEKAARGTDGRKYPWGDTYISGYANIDETDQGVLVGPYYIHQTTAVGIYLSGASPYGVLDMAGNIWEWCLNKYNYTDDTRSGGRGYSSRVMRGGAWNYNADDACCNVRLKEGASIRYNNRGFRLVSVSPAST